MKDWMHLLRLAGVFGAAALTFVVVRPFFVPDTFGEIGHYRAAAVLEARERPITFADRTTCEVCHGEVATLQTEKKSRHAQIGCQSCHGPLASHVDSSGQLKPTLPDVVPLCSRCHEAIPGRPARIPQVDTKDHSGGEKCTTCHNQHAPRIE